MCIQNYLSSLENVLWNGLFFLFNFQGQFSPNISKIGGKWGGGGGGGILDLFIAILT